MAKIYVQRPSSKSKIDEGDLLFVFRSGECIRLELSGFIEHGIAGSKDKSELEKFILACEVLAENAEIDSEVSDIRDWLRNESNEIGQLSYTEVWERELSNRFHATVFVPLEPGALLRDGKLRVVRQLAFGGLAAVYLVQKEGKELLILKEAVVPPDRDEELKEKALQMFDREARLLAALDHPRIAKVLDHFVESGRNYLLIERISGQNLRQIVNQKGPQPEPVVLGWCVEIAEILVHLHELSPPIIHRDLTPENLILAEDGHIYLIDFGAANEFIGTVTGTVVGKQSFISPEQFRGKASLSSDIYSFGGTMHFLLTGKNPLAMSVASPAQIVESISKQTDAIAVSCTCQEASGRPATARVLKEQLLNALGASVVSESKS